MIDDNIEIWRDIPGYKNLYQVSNWGQVKSLRFNRVMYQWKNNCGYLCVHLYIKGERKKYRVHYLVCKVFHGNSRGSYNEVGHKDSNKENNHAYNLFWTTRSQNMKDMHKTKRQYVKNEREEKRIRDLLQGPF